MIGASRNRGTRVDPGLTEFADRLEQFFRDNYTALVRQHLRLGSVEDVQDAIQEALLRIYARFADGEQAEPDNLTAFVNVAIRNVLIARHRRSEPISIGDAVLKKNSMEDDDDDDGRTDPPFPHPGPDQEDILAWKQLLRLVFKRLPAKSVEVAAMVMTGKSPVEIGAAYGQDGYVLRRHARQLICKTLWDLAQAGDSLAKSVGDKFCGWGRPARAT